MSIERVIWHDLECGSYGEDLELWRELAARHGSPVLELGAGTGRVALDLARRGFEIVALDLDQGLLDELERRAEGLPVRTACSDARYLALDQCFPLCLVPMQMIQLLGGAAGRAALLERVRVHLQPGGLVALALSPLLPEYEVAGGAAAPVPDVCERDGSVYFSQPTAIYARTDGYVLERRRERVSSSGERSVEHDRIFLDHLDAPGLEREGAAHGFSPAGRATVAATDDYAGSEVVMLRA